MTCEGSCYFIKNQNKPEKTQIVSDIISDGLKDLYDLVGI